MLLSLEKKPKKTQVICKVTDEVIDNDTFEVPAAIKPIDFCGFRKILFLMSDVRNGIFLNPTT